MTVVVGSGDSRTFALAAEAVMLGRPLRDSIVRRADPAPCLQLGSHTRIARSGDRFLAAKVPDSAIAHLAVFSC